MIFGLISELLLAPLSSKMKKTNKQQQQQKKKKKKQDGPILTKEYYAQYEPIMPNLKIIGYIL